MQINLRVEQGLKGDVFLDSVRIPESHRKNLKAGYFHQISYGDKTIYVALRGSQHKEAVILIDEANRKRLGVVEKVSYDFEIKRLRFYQLFLPIWYATNPYTRFAGRLGLIGFLLSVLGGLRTLLPFMSWLCSPK